MKSFSDESVALQSFFATTALHSDGFKVFVLSVNEKKIKKKQLENFSDDTTKRVHIYI